MALVAWSWGIKEIVCFNLVGGKEKQRRQE